ncbi:MAG: hypothetical protein LBV75_05235 [Paludibacter sp.]|jgi:hypothetical protein|nr:hypothetical protein [Paludibacter sp.]
MKWYKNISKEIKQHFKSFKIKDIIGGKFLSKRFFINQIPLIILIATLFFMEIHNGYYCDTQLTEIKSYNDSIRNARNEKTTIDAELQKMSIQSNIEKMIIERNIPLEKPTKPSVYIDSTRVATN